MKYRVRLDMNFDIEADAQTLMSYGKALAGKAVSVNEGREDAELSFCALELCRHDEGLPCTLLERVEVKNTEGV